MQSCKKGKMIKKRNRRKRERESNLLIRKLASWYILRLLLLLDTVPSIWGFCNILSADLPKCSHENVLGEMKLRVKLYKALVPQTIFTFYIKLLTVLHPNCINFSIPNLAFVVDRNESYLLVRAYLWLQDEEDNVKIKKFLRIMVE